MHNWITEKVDWTPEDYINAEDLNRIENNTAFYQEFLQKYGYYVPIISKENWGIRVKNELGDTGSFKLDSNSDGCADGWGRSFENNFSLNNGEQTFTPTQQYAYISNTTGRTQAGKWVFICAQIKTSDNTVFVNPSGSLYENKVHTGSNTFERIGSLAVSGADGFMFLGQTTKSSGFVPITVKEAMVVDLTNYTQLSGMTNVQKLDWCLANIPYVEFSPFGITDFPTASNTKRIIENMQFLASKHYPPPTLPALPVNLSLADYNGMTAIETYLKTLYDYLITASAQFNYCGMRACGEDFSYI